MKRHHALMLSLLALAGIVVWIIWSLRPSGWTP